MSVVLISQFFDCVSHAERKIQESKIQIAYDEEDLDDLTIGSF